MKRILTSIIIMALAVSSLSSQSKLKGGIDAGFNVSFPSNSSKAKCGFSFGGFGEISFNDRWYIDAGLKLSLRTLEWQNDNIIINTDYIHIVKASPYSLIIPIHAGYKHPVSDIVNLFVGIGPYIGTGLWGKGHCVIETSSESNVDYRAENVYTDKYMKMRRFEVGIDAVAGIEIFNHYRISLGYQRQFNNFNDGVYLTYRNHAQVLSIALGYKF